MNSVHMSNRWWCVALLLAAVARLIALPRTAAYEAPVEPPKTRQDLIKPAVGPRDGVLPAPPGQETLGAIPTFRRIFLPADEITKRNWTDGYLPIGATEFERLLETVKAATSGAPNAEAPRIESAEFVARLAEDDLLVGTLDLLLDAHGAAAGLLALDPCTPAISTAEWLAPRAKEILLGTSPDGNLRVLVQGSQLRCNWSLRGERTASGAVNFQLEFPGCAVARMTLDMPQGLDVIADGGIVSKRALQVPASTAPPLSRSWDVEFGGHNRVNLRVIPEGTARERRPLTLLRQSVTYEFSARGINLGAQLKLDIHGEPVQRIGVDLDPTLRLVAARYGDVDIAWSATTDVESRVSHVVLQLPEAVVGTGRVLQLSALAPLTVGEDHGVCRACGPRQWLGKRARQRF